MGDIVTNQTAKQVENCNIALWKDEEIQELAVSLRNAETAYDYQNYLEQFLLALENQDNIEISTTETAPGVTEEEYTITKTFDFTLGSAEGTV